MMRLTRFELHHPAFTWGDKDLLVRGHVEDHSCQQLVRHPQEFALRYDAILALNRFDGFLNVLLFGWEVRIAFDSELRLREDGSADVSAEDFPAICERAQVAAVGTFEKLRRLMNEQAPRAGFNAPQSGF